MDKEAPEIFVHEDYNGLIIVNERLNLLDTRYIRADIHESRIKELEEVLRKVNHTIQRHGKIENHTLLHAEILEALKQTQS